MTNNTRNAIYACLLLLAITVGACVKDSTVPESIHKQPQDFQLADAKKHYEENIENLCFPEIYLKPIIYTKGSNYFHNLKQTPLWDRFNFTENGWSYIYEIPILYNITLKASMGHLTQDGHLKKEDKEVNLQSNLIIQKYKKSGNVHIFLSTVIGYISEPDNEIEGESPWLWTGDRRNFTGYQFFTNPDGSFRSAFHKYVLGNPKHEDLGKQSVIEKALKFYAERGLKITYAKKINNTYTWSNVSVNGTTVNYLNCLN